MHTRLLPRVPPGGGPGHPVGSVSLPVVEQLCTALVERVESIKNSLNDRQHVGEVGFLALLVEILLEVLGQLGVQVGHEQGSLHVRVLLVVPGDFEVRLHGLLPGLEVVDPILDVEQFLGPV